ncbi:hypothetical protein GW17_00007555 [Ensete ventricosum]|nr:hypothetical protein GW17_00007555 [Ensete ventricosum]
MNASGDAVTIRGNVQHATTATATATASPAGPRAWDVFSECTSSSRPPPTYRFIGRPYYLLHVPFIRPHFCKLSFVEETIRLPLHSFSTKVAAVPARCTL